MVRLGTQLSLDAEHRPSRIVTSFLLTGATFNGEGQSIQLDGHQFALYAALDDSNTLFPEQFTISAWLSLPASEVSAPGNAFSVIWPIVSTLGGSGRCGGYQLDIRVEDPAIGPELVLSYQFEPAGDAGAACNSHELIYPIDNPSWAWGIGRWHHAAGTYTQVGVNEATLALYWDGVRATVGSNPVIVGRFK